MKYAESFDCQVGIFPVKYLGVPISPSRLKISDWLRLIEKGNVWKGGAFLWLAGPPRLVPIYTVRPCITCQYTSSQKLLFLRWIKLEGPF